MKFKKAIHHYPFIYSSLFVFIFLFKISSKTLEKNYLSYQLNGFPINYPFHPSSPNNPYDQTNKTNNNTFPPGPGDKGDYYQQQDLQRKINELKRECDEFMIKNQGLTQKNQEQKTQIEIEKIYIYTLLAILILLVVVDIIILLYIFFKSCSKEKLAKSFNGLLFKTDESEKNDLFINNVSEIGINSQSSSRKGSKSIESKSEKKLRDKQKLNSKAKVVCSTSFNILGTNSLNNSLNNSLYKNNNLSTKYNKTFGGDEEEEINNEGAPVIALDFNKQEGYDNENDNGGILLTNTGNSMVDKIIEKSMVNPYCEEPKNHLKESN